MSGPTAPAVEEVTDLADPIMFDDPYPRYAALRRTAPVSRARSKQLLGREGWMLTRHEDVMLLHGDPRFSSQPSGGDNALTRHLPRMFRLLLDSMVYKDDPDHARLRRLVNKAFTPRMVQQMNDDIERVVDELLDGLERADGPVDLVQAFCVPLPLTVISTMLGVADADRDRFHVLMERFTNGLGSGSALEAIRAVPTARKLMVVIERLADERRVQPDDAMISALLSASEDGDRLSGDEVIAMIFLLMLAGHDTTANLIGSSVVALMEHPHEAQRLRREPSLAASATEELLRYTSPVPCGAARTVLEDVEISGITIPKGDKVLGMIISANRDESVFNDPDHLHLDRDPNRHLSFAFGKHFCLGNQLARMEGQVAIGALLRRFPNMTLAVPRARLRYKPVQPLRGFRELPVTLR
ncbi:MAG TPA: cytochrome P450 [Acidimicrobiales bacterium]|nr:cytochrome P450 [Acidimicrobiales bacterium]